MKGHIHEPDFVRFANRRMTAADASRLQRHLITCELCLSRLIDLEIRESMKDPVWQHEPSDFEVRACDNMGCSLPS